jgi:isocitrate lyase
VFDGVAERFVAAWEQDSGLQTCGDAVAAMLAFRAGEGEPLEMGVETPS